MPFVYHILKPQLMIKDEIQKLIHKYLKDHDKEKVNIFRYLLSQIKYREIDLKKEITDEQTIAVLQKEVKKRQEAIELFQKGNRPDLVAANKKEIEIINQFLPAQLSDEEITKIIDDILKKQPDHLNPGEIIGQVVGITKGRASGGKIAELVKEKIKNAG